MSAANIVDTNVGVVANDRVGENTRSAECVLACVRFLSELMSSGVIAIDTDWAILGEYTSRLRSEGEPGIGDAFLKWVLTHQASTDRCVQVDISETPVPSLLAGFDPADVKFIKTAITCSDSEIAQASDSLWWKRRADFDAAHIVVNFLCPDEIKRLSDRKHGL